MTNEKMKFYYLCTVYGLTPELWRDVEEIEKFASWYK